MSPGHPRLVPTVADAPPAIAPRHAIAFAGDVFLALPDRALFWPRRRALLVADLHLEKASWFAGHRQLLPPYDSRATLERLLTLAIRLDAQEIWALGDSFHDDAGVARLGSAERALLAALADGRRVHWIAGNHDAAAALPGARIEEALVDGIILRHEALPTEQRPEISGHFHPKWRSAGVSRPCFVVDAQRLILPAFGALTGGLDAQSAPIRALIGGDAAVIVATRARACRFSLPEGPTRP